MSERLNTCPKCGEIQYSDNIVESHNPDTHDLNMRATLQCNKCNHIWEGLVTSPHYENMRCRGWIR